MKTPVVFSLVREQSVFMTVIMALLTFLSVIALGVAIAIGTGVARWNTQWDLMATVQVMPGQNMETTTKILDANKDKIASVKKISSDEMTELMRPWISGGGAAMKNYLPEMYEIKLNKKADMKSLADKFSGNARFLSHSAAMSPATGAGWRMIAIAGLILTMALGAIGVCISFIARNTALLHRRELEILNQVGARDNFVARQMQIIVGKISITAAIAGFVAATPVLLLILSAAHHARVGLMAMMALNGAAWTLLAAMPIAISIIAIWITGRTTLNILKNS
ncbi:MAG: hypothetical protein K2I81_03505 [Alphaproteobacteria bacterium]|nr:hypothetical protein [Alphaproteobacteria bacterium]